jgi:RNA polymerase sigma factor (TIGR02999 family)
LCYLVTREGERNVLTGCFALVLTAPGEARQDGGSVAKSDARDVTTLLYAWREGDVEARDRLMLVVYQELRRRAAAYLRRERQDHTLEPTALVHEAYLRLVKQDRVDWQNRAQFFGVASQMMRRILIDHARSGKMAKRSGQWLRVTLDEGVADLAPPDVQILDLDRALVRLAEFDHRKSQIAELRFFGGLSLAEVAHVLDISVSTVERDWQIARAWLYAALKGEPTP